MSWEDFDLGGSSKRSHSEAKQAVYQAGALPYYLYPLWAVGFFGVTAISHFNWRK
jgi:hypothetical protein